MPPQHWPSPRRLNVPVVMQFEDAGSVNGSTPRDTAVADIGMIMLSFFFCFGIILLPLCIFLAFRCYARHARRRGRTHACWGFVELPNDLEMTASQVASSEVTKRDHLEASVVRAVAMLPSTPWTCADIDDSEAAVAATEPCALCLESFQDGELVKRLPPCAHLFHTQCIDRWLINGQRHKKRRCPLCNTDPFAGGLTPDRHPSAPAPVPSPQTPQIVA